MSFIDRLDGGHKGGVWRSKESQNMLSNIHATAKQRTTEKDIKRSRENHMEVNTVKKDGEENNSPKERESEKRALPHAEVLIFPFKQENKDKTFRICIKEFEDVFAWRLEDMPSIDPAVAIHMLYVDPTFSHVKQRKGCSMMKKT
ncbi:hypothetical protein LIER_03349 [Lithospermum erythrorhizon]|uniref:Uncharacterized protein n=1 Tax=Lithospermum erythrorhizon TaxID=34254 RepID=A0AAV3NSU1_LITER